MYKDIIEEIEKIQLSRIQVIANHPNGDTNIQAPQKKCAGLYFFYTDYSDDELIASGNKPTNSAVPISQLVNEQLFLNLVRKTEKDGFRLVYNGVGGYNGGNGYDLRTRILQEISSSHPKTGSLCIKQSALSDLNRWRFSFVIMPCLSETKIKPDIDEKWIFESHALNIERYWRLHYGWPLLCRK